MPFLHVVLGADPGEASHGKAPRNLVDNANPSYRGRLAFVRSWLIEFDDDGGPWREIGLDESGSVVLAGPSSVDYGYWLDTPMRYSDFKGNPISREFFEELWLRSGVLAP
ncbi:hypothetical protein [Kinneretia aquatilis]|uniref:hypothetical protein n=1 Tax=Kinneretia aquatilis TaxID=2070761 RepID=UPI001495156C|nr:hypothetical protein [Paucibacter aquatile]WIV98778.1 hypothetical protein K9V56_004585 [Paucibacter aquatile]